MDSLAGVSGTADVFLKLKSKICDWFPTSRLPIYSKRRLNIYIPLSFITVTAFQTPANSLPSYCTSHMAPWLRYFTPAPH